MKVKSAQVKSLFQPIELTITLETPEEQGALYAVFNHSVVTGVIEKSGINHLAIRQAIGNQADYGMQLDELTERMKRVI